MTLQISKSKKIHIEPIDHQAFQKTDEALPKGGTGYFIYTIIGQKGTGKSTILIGLLKDYFKKYYDNIYFVSPSARRDDKFKTLIDELEPEGKFFDTLNDDVASEIMNNLIKNIDEDETRNLTIFDDCINLLPSSSDKESPFNTFIISSRHYKTDIIITAQKYNRLNTTIRANTDIISIFPSNNRKELETYVKELNISPDKLHEYIEYISDDKHNFLTISYIAGKTARPTCYVNFDQIIEFK